MKYNKIRIGLKAVGSAAFAIGAALFSGGCRTAYEPASERDLAYHEVFVKHNLGGRPESAEQYIPNAIKSLDDLAEGRAGKPDDFDFSRYKTELGENYASAVRLKETNAVLERACSGLKAYTAELAVYLNGMLEDIRKAGKLPNDAERFIESLSKKHQKALIDSRIALDDFAKHVRNYPDEFWTISALRNGARKSGRKELADKVDETISKYERNISAVELSKILEISLNDSEGRYNGGNIFGDIDLIDKLEKIRTGVGFLELGENVYNRVIDKDSAKKALESISGHFEHDGATDLDDVVREHRWALAKRLWKSYMDGETSGREVNSALLHLDYEIAKTARDTCPRSTGKKILTNGLNTIVPGLPLYFLLKDISYLTPSDTVAGSGNETIDDLIAKALRLRDGADNAKHLVGDKGAVWNDAGISLLQTAAQAALLHSLSNGGGHGGGGGDGTPAGDTPPGPHGH